MQKQNLAIELGQSSLMWIRTRVSGDDLKRSLESFVVGGDDDSQMQGCCAQAAREPAVNHAGPVIGEY